MKFPCLVPVLFALAASASQNLSAAIVYYSESFPNGTSANIGHSNASIVWNANIGTSATVNSGNTNNSSGFVVPNSVGGYGAKANTGSPGIAWTSEFAPIDLASTSITTLSFLSNNNSADLMKFAVRVDSQWYVTSANFSHAGGGNFADWSLAETEVFNFTTAAASWQILDFTSGSTLNVGSVLTTDLPQGSLTAAGIYIPSNSGIVRYDDFTINIVPEPSGVILGGLGVLACIGRRRR